MNRLLSCNMIKMTGEGRVERYCKWRCREDMRLQWEAVCVCVCNNMSQQYLLVLSHPCCAVRVRGVRSSHDRTT